MIQHVEIKQASAEDIREFTGHYCPYTVYAWIAYYRGMPACLAGVMLEPGKAVPFSDVLPNKAPKPTIWKTARVLFENIKSLNLPLTTACLNYSRFLEELGFVHAGTYEGHEVYKWS